MKKSVVTLGEKGCELLYAADYLTNGGNAVTIDHANIEKRSAFNECDENTQVIVIENIVTVDQITRYYNFVTGGVRIKRPEQKAFTIHPVFILVSENLKVDELPKDLSFKYRFSVIYK